MIFLLNAILKYDTVAQMCLIDFKKAFIHVEHSTVVIQLCLLECRRLVLSFIVFFLKGREQCTGYNGQTSAWLTTTCGVPQWTCIGPFIFAVINNLLQDSSQKPNFVDSVTVYTVSK